jgi:TctA family transporter
MAEANLRRAMIIADNSIVDVISRPITAIFLILALLSLITSLLRQWRSKQ